MDQKRRSENNAAFYAALAMCLLAIAAGGLWMLLRRDVPEQSAVEDRRAAEARGTAAPEGAVQSELPMVTTMLPQLPQAEEEPELPAGGAETEISETAAGASMPESAVPEPIHVQLPPDPAPSTEIDDTPVLFQEPLSVVTPLSGEVVSAFSMDQLAYNETLSDWRVHNGVDIAAEEGTGVLAACAGTVLSVEDDPLMGSTVVLRHEDGYVSTYANLQPSPGVEAGEEVLAGQTIGAVGTSARAESAQGPHLHFSVSKDGAYVDPEVFLR